MQTDTATEETKKNQKPGSSEGGEVVLEMLDSVAVVRLGDPDERVVTIDQRRMDSLERVLGQLEQQTGLAGVVFTGNRPGLFCAGADINAIKEVDDARVAEQLARRGQEIFQRIEDLKCPTVAAITGPCVGGGYEMVLACDYRIAADTPELKVGLPEIKLGILPGFGGTQRLPRLIGIRKALDVILKGRVVGARKASRLGLVDQLIEREGDDADGSELYSRLTSFAVDVVFGKRKLHRPSFSFGERILTFTSIGRNIVRSQVAPQLERTTKGHYPAPSRALEMVVHGLTVGTRDGLLAEAQALGELLVSPESKSLVHVYLLSDEASKRFASAKDEVAQAKVGVVGAGVMGAGIASSMVMSGVPVVLADLQEDALKRARSHVIKSLERRFRDDPARAAAAMDRLEFTSSLEEMKECSLVVEAIVEKLDAKKQLFTTLAGILSPDAVIASNTSSLPISDLAAGIAGEDRIIGMHFFNPVEKMPLVEVVRSKGSSSRTIAYTAALASRLNKYPVVAEEVPGFLVNRMLSPYLVEAAWALSEGYTVEEIDSAATQFGMPMGPLRLLDEVGLDVAGHVAEILQSSYGVRMEGPPFASKLASQGRLGRKSGEGFYKYDGKDEAPDPFLVTLLGLPETAGRKGGSGKDTTNLTDRLILSLVNEAIRCLEEGVAGVPGPDAAGQIDLASVMGIGFAPFRGGIIRYAQTRGPKEIHTRLTQLEQRHGERFTPAPGSFFGTG